jgi:hypothetical protein
MYEFVSATLPLDDTPEEIGFLAARISGDNLTSRQAGIEVDRAVDRFGRSPVAWK